MATSSTSSTIPPENTLPPTTSSLPPVTTSTDPGLLLPTSSTTVTPVVDGDGGFPSSINTTQTSPPPLPPPADLIPELLPVFAPVVATAASPVNTFSTCIDEAAVDITPASPIAGTCTCSTVPVSRPNPNTPVTNIPDLIPVSGPVLVTDPIVPVITDVTPDTSTAPNYIASFIGGDVSKFNNIMYRGAVQGIDGKLYIIPYASDNLTATNLSNGSQVGYDITSFARPRSLAKFIGGVLAPNGKIYLGPQEASTPLIIDTNQTPPILTQVAGGSGSVVQARGPAYYDSRVYIPTYKNGTTQIWLVVNTDNDTLEPSIIQPTHPTTDEIFLTRVDYATEDSGKAIKHYDSLEGGVAGNNGKIYGMPYGASRINIVDTDTQTSTWGEDYITGNAPVDNDPFSTIPGGMLQTKTYFNKYKYGALANNGNIYAHGHRARSILKIDTSDDSATEIPYPQVIIDAMLNGGSEDSADTAKAASFGSVLGSDGKVYSTPWNIPYLIWIDPTDDSIGYLDISDILESSESDINNGWYTLAAAVGNKLYFSPGTSEKILVIELPGSDSGTNIINPLGEPTLTFDTNAIDPAVDIIFDNGSEGGAEPIVEGGGFDPALINNFTCEDADVSWYLDDAYAEWFNSDEANLGNEEALKEAPMYIGEAELASMIRDGRMSGNEVADGTFEINAFSGNAVQFSNNKVVVEGSEVTVNGQELADPQFRLAQNLPIGSQTIDLVKVKEGIVKSVDPPVVANYKGQLHLFVVTIEIPQGYTNYPGTIECILLGTSYKEDDVVFTDIETGGTDTNSGPIQRPAVTVDNTNGKIIETGTPTDTTGTSKEPTPLNLVCYDDGDNVLSFKQDGANPFWKIGQNAQQGAANIRVENFPFNPSIVYNLPVGTLVKPLLDLENDPGNIEDVIPAKVPDTVDKRVEYKVKLSIPDRYDNSDEDYLYCSVYSYLSALSALSGRVLECYGDNNADPKEKNNAGFEIDYANPTWNAAAVNLVGQFNILNFPPVDPSTIFNIPIGTPISPLIDIEIGTLARVTPAIVPDNVPGPIRVEVEIEVPKDQGYINEGEITCYMEMFPPISGTTTGTPPPPPPPPPGVPLDECMLECLTYTTPGPAQPGDPRPVPVRFTVPIERTTIPPVFPLNPPSNRTVPPTVPPPGTTPTTSTTTTTTLNPCPPECDIPSF